MLDVGSGGWRLEARSWRLDDGLSCRLRELLCGGGCSVEAGETACDPFACAQLMRFPGSPWLFLGGVVLPEEFGGPTTEQKAAERAVSEGGVVLLPDVADVVGGARGGERRFGVAQGEGVVGCYWGSGGTFGSCWGRTFGPCCGRTFGSRCGPCCGRAFGSRCGGTCGSRCGPCCGRAFGSRCGGTCGGAFGVHFASLHRLHVGRACVRGVRRRRREALACARARLRRRWLRFPVRPQPRPSPQGLRRFRRRPRRPR